jgi:hypothetical protein
MKTLDFLSCFLQSRKNISLGAYDKAASLLIAAFSDGGPATVGIKSSYLLDELISLKTKSQTASLWIEEMIKQYNESNLHSSFDDHIYKKLTASSPKK